MRNRACLGSDLRGAHAWRWARETRGRFGVRVHRRVPTRRAQGRGANAILPVYRRQRRGRTQKETHSEDQIPRLRSGRAQWRKTKNLPVLRMCFLLA